MTWRSLGPLWLLAEPGVRFVRLRELLLVPPSLLALVLGHRLRQGTGMERLCRAGPCLARAARARAAGRAPRCSVSGRFLFNWPFKLPKILCRRHKQLHGYRCDDWCCLMSILIKSYNHSVEMGLKVSLKRGKLLCISFRSVFPLPWPSLL